jgi:hypothetical protein
LGELVLEGGQAEMVDLFSFFDTLHLLTYEKTSSINRFIRNRWE